MAEQEELGKTRKKRRSTATGQQKRKRRSDLGQPRKKTDVGTKILEGVGQVGAGTVGFVVGHQAHKATVSDDPNAFDFPAVMLTLAGLGGVTFIEDKYLRAASLGFALNGARQLLLRLDAQLAGTRMQPLAGYLDTSDSRRSGTAGAGKQASGVGTGKVNRREAVKVFMPQNEKVISKNQMKGAETRQFGQGVPNRITEIAGVILPKDVPAVASEMNVLVSDAPQNATYVDWGKGKKSKW